MPQNPYSLVFGKEPGQLIARLVPEDEVIYNFTAKQPSQQIYMITGVRGSGKTVFMTDIAGRLKKKAEWVVVELNPERDLLVSLAAKLSSETSLARLFQNANINLSFWGFGFEVQGAAPITDIETALTKMLESLKKNGKRLLITIDEVTSSHEMKVFASAYQIFLRQDLPVFLLMTGLYENIYSLQNEKNLTFLYRAPKIELKPLNFGAIALNYQKNLSVTPDEARRMAQLTQGYSFAFQVLGYLTWENGGNYADVIPRYRLYLEEYVYEKIWSELSETDQRVAEAIARSDDGRIAGIRAALGMSTNQFNPYRTRLIRKGIVNGDVRGYVRFTLPLFKDFVLEHTEETVEPD